MSCFRSNLELGPEDLLCPYHLEFQLGKHVYIIDLSNLLHDMFSAELGCLEGLKESSHYWLHWKRGLISPSVSQRSFPQNDRSAVHYARVSYSNKCPPKSGSK